MGTPKDCICPSTDRQTEVWGEQRPVLCKVKLPVQQALNQDGALLGQGLWDLGHREPV